MNPKVIQFYCLLCIVMEKSIASKKNRAFIDHTNIRDTHQIVGANRTVYSESGDLCQHCHMAINMSSLSSRNTKFFSIKNTVLSYQWS